MSTWLHDHLVREHSRTWHELSALPAAAAHRLEHFEQAMGLLHLDHRHRRDAISGDLLPPEPA